MREGETIREAVARGIMALEHMLICHDIGRVLGPKVEAGDPEAVAIVRRAAAHMRRLSGRTEV